MKVDCSSYLSERIAECSGIGIAKKIKPALMLSKPGYGVVVVNDLTINRVLSQNRFIQDGQSPQQSAASLFAALTPRQRQVMELVLAGESSKGIAIDLGISQRTVEHHRALVMKKTCCRSIPALARLGVAAAYEGMQTMDNLRKQESLATLCEEY